MKLADLQPGHVVYFWHQEYSGTKPRSTIVYATVLKIGRVLVQVGDEYGTVRWRRENVIALLLGRSESEIICFRDDVTQRTETLLP